MEICDREGGVISGINVGLVAVAGGTVIDPIADNTRVRIGVPSEGNLGCM